MRGYSRERLLRDVGAGATVGIVALPLAMAFAIASGLKPEAGLRTAIIAGFIISALGGTSVQIGGPAGAFIVIVYGIVERYGVANLLIATASAGVLLFLLGLFRLGTLVRCMPVSVVIGFTIARTVTNIRAGASSPIGSIVLSLALVVLLAAPLAQHIPLAVLAGVLIFVAWNMGEWREFARLKHFSNHYRLMMVCTFLVTIVFDFTVAVELGLALTVVLFVRRQSELFRADLAEESADQVTYALYGSLFFGTIAKIDPILARVEQAPGPAHVLLDASRLISLDTTGLGALKQLHKAIAKRDGTLGMTGMTGLNPQPLSLIQRSGFAAHLRTCA